MKYLFLILTLLLTSCVGDTQAAQFSRHFQETSVMVSDHNWQFQVPMGWQNLIDQPNDTILAGYGLDNTKVFLTQEPIDGSLKDYASDVHALLQRKGEHIIYMMPYTINNQEVYLLMGETENKKIWTWLTVKNQMGYGLTCGGSSSSDIEDWLTQTCGEISKSFFIK